MKETSNGGSLDLQRLLDERMRELKSREDDLKTLTDNLPGGILRCKFDEKLTITYVSDGFLELFGYTRQEVKKLFDDSFYAMIYPEDRAEALRSAIEQIKVGNTKELEYRIKRKDGQIFWILDRGQLVKSEDGTPAFFCMLLDVTTMISAKEDLRLSLERHKIIMDQTTDILYEWDIPGDTIIFSGNWEKTFSFEPPKFGLKNYVSSSDHLHREDLKDFLSTLEKVRSGSKYSEVEFRLRNDEKDEYKWYKTRTTLQFDASGVPFKAVGVLINVDAEKRDRQKLLEKAERDALTGLYNKSMVQIMIENKLEGKGKNSLNAFMIVDIDNFKVINDTCGHLYGDAILTDISKELCSLFRSTDVIGRIGGDEFAVFVQNMSDRAAVVRKAEEILSAFHNLLADEDSLLSCSIGISLTPADGVNYMTLYRNADIALYQAKRLGKNRYSFFEQEAEDASSAYANLSQRSPLDSEDEKSVFQSRFAEDVFSLLYRAENTIKAIPSILEYIGRQYDVSRVYIFENSENGLIFSNTFEWCSEGVAPEIQNLQNLDYRELDDYASHFDENGLFYCKDISLLPDSQKIVLESQGIKSVLQCGILDNGKYCGFVGFDEIRKNRRWTQMQIDSLTFVARIIGTFLAKERSSRNAFQLASSMEDLVERQNFWIYVIDSKTYDILYVNRKTKELVPNLKYGEKCYKTFFDLDRPCDHCPVLRLKGSDNPGVRMYSKLLERDFQADVSFLKWRDHSDACMVSARDLEEEKK